MKRRALIENCWRGAALLGTLGFSIRTVRALEDKSDKGNGKEEMKRFSPSTKVSDILAAPVFASFARLLFPVNTGYWRGGTLGELSFTWFSFMSGDTTATVLNRLYADVSAGKQVFYDIYTDEEKARDSRKRNTGLFFFRGDKGAPFAVCNAGGGFAYVGAMHDSFPHALEISKHGLNAFALIYRPGARTACEDLARAIAFVFDNAERLGVSTKDYSLWGGSAGARMAAWLGSMGPDAFGESHLPKSAAVVMQYTGHAEVSPEDPPTFACCGEDDWIADWRLMRERLRVLESYGIDTEFHLYRGLPHGFGIGVGTIAYGWLDLAVAFWRRQMQPA